MTTTTAPTWTTKTLTEASYRSIFDTTTITLTETVCDNPEVLPAGVEHLATYYEVSGINLHNAHRTQWVTGTHKKTFLDLEEARAYANRWATRLEAKGWHRIA